MRKISAWAAIIAVPTAVAGIYGMNFDHMPELKWRFGYPAVLAVIVVSAAICTSGSAAPAGSDSGCDSTRVFGARNSRVETGRTAFRPRL